MAIEIMSVPIKHGDFPIFQSYVTNYHQEVLTQSWAETRDPSNLGESQISPALPGCWNSRTLGVETRRFQHWPHGKTMGRSSMNCKWLFVTGTSSIKQGFHGYIKKNYHGKNWYLIYSNIIWWDEECGCILCKSSWQLKSHLILFMTGKI